MGQAYFLALARVESAYVALSATRMVGLLGLLQPIPYIPTQGSFLSPGCKKSVGACPWGWLFQCEAERRTGHNGLTSN
jgi:hypothetical protein